MKVEDMRQLSDEEISRRLDEAREAHFNLRVQHASGALERTSELGARRKEIARYLTIAHERELATR